MEESWILKGRGKEGPTLAGGGPLNIFSTSSGGTSVRFVGFWLKANPLST